MRLRNTLAPEQFKLPAYDLDRLGREIEERVAAQLADLVITEAGRPKSYACGAALKWYEGAWKIQEHVSHLLARDPTEQFETILGSIEKEGGFIRGIIVLEDWYTRTDQYREIWGEVMGEIEKTMLSALRSGRILGFYPDGDALLFRAPSMWESWSYVRGPSNDRGLFLCSDGLAAPGDAKRKKSPGRPRGSGSYEEHDLPLLCEMRDMLARREVASAAEAATRLAERATGGGSANSKADRLRKRYEAKYG